MHGRAILGHDDRFLLIVRLLLILKGYTLNCSPCNFREIAYFCDFFDVSQLSYKPSNFARANSPMPWVKGLKMDARKICLMQISRGGKSLNTVPKRNKKNFVLELTCPLQHRGGTSGTDPRRRGATGYPLPLQTRHRITIDTTFLFSLEH